MPLTFELPSETFELPYDGVVHNAFHGAVHFWSSNNAIQQVPHALAQAGEQPLIRSFASPSESPSESPGP